MRVLLAAQPVLRDLGAGDDQHAVLARSARSACVADVVEIGARSPASRTPKARRPERGEPAGARQQVLLHQDVIGDRDHVELARSSRRDRRPRATDSLPSLHCVWTWKSQSRNGSYPGIVQTCLTSRCVRVLRPMVQHLRREVADVEPEDRALPHRDVAARRGVQVAVVEQADAGRSANSRRPRLVSSPWNSIEVSKPPMRSSASRRTAKLPP